MAWAFSSVKQRKGINPIRGFLPRRLGSLSLRICASLFIVAAITFVLFRLVPVNAAAVGFLYLVAVLFIATKGGIVESTIASLAAVLCFNFFFLPPIGTLTISDPHNFIALYAFLVTSLTASQLSARAKRRTKEAEAGRSEVESLYSLSRALLSTDPAQPIAKQIVRHIIQTCECPSLALYVRDSDEACVAGLSEASLAPMLRESASRSVEIRDENNALTVTPIRLGGVSIGSLAVCDGVFSDAALHSLVNLVAIGLERAESQKMVTRAEVARQSGELKSTLLDAIAHEFKTPLTSIKAVTTDLLSLPSPALDAHQRELISIVDESADRLSKLVTDAIQLARIEGGQFRLNLSKRLPLALVSRALRQMKSVIDERKITVSVPDNLPMVCVDAELIQLVITHMIDNALKYSPPSRPIVIEAYLAGEKVIMQISDQGQGIAEEEQARVFEKFYRGKRQQHLKGTGMGLAIAREIMRAHGENIGLSSQPGQGAQFSFAMPVATGGGKS